MCIGDKMGILDESKKKDDETSWYNKRGSTGNVFLTPWSIMIKP